MMIYFPTTYSTKDDDQAKKEKQEKTVVRKVHFKI